MRATLFSLLLIPLMLAGCAPTYHDAQSKGASMVQLAHQMEDAKDFSAALDFYNKALIRDPKNFPALTGKASILKERGDKAGALGLYKLAEGLRPENAEVQKELGLLLLKTGEMAAAEKALNMAEKNLAPSSDMLIAMGVIQGKKGDSKQAEIYFKRALTLDPQNLAARNNLAFLMTQQNRPEEAVDLLEVYANMPDASPTLRQNLAAAYALSGMMLDAKRLAQKDLSEENVEKNMAYYEAKHKSSKAYQGKYALVGTYPTRAIADMFEKIWQEDLEKDNKKLSTNIRTTLSDIGEAPQFDLVLWNPRNPTAAAAFCTGLKAENVPCELVD